MAYLLNKQELLVRTRNTVIAALIVKLGEADTLICGTVGTYGRHLGHIINIIGLQPEASNFHAINILILEQSVLFIADTHVSINPNSQELAEIAVHASYVCTQFGIKPKVAMLSHSNFGSNY